MRRSTYSIMRKIKNNKVKNLKSQKKVNKLLLTNNLKLSFTITILDSNQRIINEILKFILLLNEKLNMLAFFHV